MPFGKRFFRQDLIDGLVVLPGQDQSLRRIQRFTEHRSQVMEVAQFIGHYKAGVLRADVQRHIGGRAPVAESGAAGGVHQVASGVSEGKGGEKDWLAFQVFYLAEGRLNSCPDAGKQDGPHLQPAAEGGALRIWAFGRRLTGLVDAGKEFIALGRWHQVFSTPGIADQPQSGQQLRLPAERF